VENTDPLALPRRACGIIPGMAKEGRPGHGAERISRREAEVLDALALRLSNREIADTLGISQRTVESHVSALLRKTSTSSRRQLARAGASRGRPFPVPQYTTSFVGRDSDLRALIGILTEQRLVTLVGPGGSGKSRLAAEAAQLSTRAVRFIDLQDVDPSDAAAAVLTGLGLTPAGAADLAGMLRVSMPGQNLLVVLDGCERVTHCLAPLLETVLTSGQDLTILATSRRPFGTPIEFVRTLAPLPVPVAGATAAELRAAPAGRLFIDRWRAADRGPGLDERAAAVAADIVRRLDGLPLALELAAARARVIPLDALAAQLAGRVEVLEQSGRVDRHRTLTAAVRWSLDRLVEPDRVVLERLAALPAGQRLRDLEVVVPDPRLARDAIEPALARLADQSMITITTPVVPAGQGRRATAEYGLLGTVRAVVLAQMPPADRQRTRHRQARWCAGRAMEVSAHLRGRGQDQWAGAARDELNGWLAALDWAIEPAPDIAADLVSALGDVLEYLGPTRIALAIVQRAATAPAWLAVAPSRALAAAGRLLLFTDLDLAERLAQAAVARDQVPTAEAAWSLGLVLAYRGDAAAAAALHVAQADADRTGDPWLVASIAQAQGLAATDAGDAMTFLERAVTGYAAAGDLLHVSNARYMLARNAVDARTRLAEARVWLREGIAYAISQDNEHELCHARLTRAALAEVDGDRRTAAAVAADLEPVFRRIGDLRCVTRALLLLSRTTDHPVRAAQFAQQALEVAVEAHDHAAQARILWILVSAGVAADQLPLAARALGALEAASADRPGAARVDEPAARLRADPRLHVLIREGAAGGASLVAATPPPPPGRNPA